MTSEKTNGQKPSKKKRMPDQPQKPQQALPGSTTPQQPMTPQQLLLEAAKNPIYAALMRQIDVTEDEFAASDKANLKAAVKAGKVWFELREVYKAINGFGWTLFKEALAATKGITGRTADNQIVCYKVCDGKPESEWPSGVFECLHPGKKDMGWDENAKHKGDEKPLKWYLMTPAEQQAWQTEQDDAEIAAAEAKLAAAKERREAKKSEPGKTDGKANEATAPPTPLELEETAAGVDGAPDDEEEQDNPRPEEQDAIGAEIARINDQIAEFFRTKVADADVKPTVRFLRLKPGKHEITVSKHNLMIVPRNPNK